MERKLARVESAFAIRDERGRALAYVYFVNDDTRLFSMYGLMEAEALEIAKRIARLLAEPQPDR